MVIWRVPSSDTEPVIRLVRWCVLETERGERHFVGYNVNAGEGRVSSAIRELDTDKAQGTTRSGRVYRLEGPPGFDPDAGATWNDWARINGVARAVDVTEVLFGNRSPAP